MFALDKVSSFTSPQIGDSCWDWIGADHRLTMHKGNGDESSGGSTHWTSSAMRSGTVVIVVTIMR